MTDVQINTLKAFAEKHGLTLDLKEHGFKLSGTNVPDDDVIGMPDLLTEIGYFDASTREMEFYSFWEKGAHGNPDSVKESICVFFK